MIKKAILPFLVLLIENYGLSQNITRTPILITSKWDQSEPYNVYLNNLFDDNGIYLGCGTIAMAQLLNYYQYPILGKGSISYNEATFPPVLPNLGVITASFEDSYYEWNLFADKLWINYYDFEYGDANGNYLEGKDLINARKLSETLFDAAASIKTNFGYDGSSSAINSIFGGDIKEALEKYWGYEVEHKRALFYSKKDWVDMIKKEIDSGRPVILAGGKPFGKRHAFICDAYDENDNFHFNFGWGQTFDSQSSSRYWMPIDDITLDGHDYSFNDLMEILIGIKPNLENVADDKYEYDNTFETAQEIENHTQQLHSISQFSDLDYFSFTLERESDITIKTEGINGVTQIWLYDGAKAFLDYDAYGGLSNNASLTRTLPAGKYYFMIDEKGNDETIPSYVVSFDAISLGYQSLEISNYLIKDGINGEGEGNGDGRAESGEQIDLEVEIFNAGDANAQSVSAKLSTSDPDITITDNDISWGRIDPNTGVFASDFDFNISFTCPSKNVVFTLEITSNEGRWEDTFIIPVYNSPGIYIPDTNFEQALIDQGIDTEGILNQKILLNDALAVTDDLRFDGLGIKDLTGLRAFENLERLYVEDNGLTELDVSENKKLRVLRCGNNQLTNLNLRENLNLNQLRASNNALAYLDLSKNTDLQVISIGSNRLTSLDLRENTKLINLSCAHNLLKSLNLSNNPALTHLACKANELVVLDLNNNLELLELECDSNKLTSLDLRRNSSLQELDCGSNQLTSILFSDNSSLIEINCESNYLTKFDASKHSNLAELDVDSNELYALDLSNNKQLKDIECRSNKLVFLDMRNGIEPAQVNLKATNNNLNCIAVDDENMGDYWSLDEGVTYNADCKYLAISPEFRQIDQSEGTVLFEVFSNETWTVSVDVDWIIIDEITNTSFIAKYSENDKYQLRVGIVTLSGSGLTRSITIEQAAIPCVPPVSFEQANITQTSIDLNWNSVEGAEGYSLEYRKQGSSDWIRVATNLESNEYKLVDITCDTSYEYQIQTHCGNDYYSEWSDTQTFKTNFCDSDYDSVPNDRDLCPDTAAGESVNVDGCSERQLNETPTEIQLSSVLIDENNEKSDLIGLLTSTDPDTDDTHTYSLITGEGDEANISFSIDGDQLLAGESFDFELKSSYSIRIRTTDMGGESFEKQFTISISDINEAPTALSLSNLSIEENSEMGTVVGTFTTTDQDLDDEHIYTLEAGVEDNNLFQIVDDELLVNSVIDFETLTGYDNVVTVQDKGGETLEESFAIEVVNVIEASIEIPQSMAFETTALGTMDSLEFTITNTGEKKTTATFTSTAEAFTFNPSFADLEIGDTSSITVIFRPTISKVYQEQITVGFDNGEQESLIELTGEGAIITSADNGKFKAEDVEVYPNPAKDEIIVDLSVFGAYQSELRFISPEGKELILLKNIKEGKLVLDTSGFPSGVYVFRISGDFGQVYRKVIIKR